jgi:transcriptional regulator with XRE-family HTH domain
VAGRRGGGQDISALSGDAPGRRITLGVALRRTAAHACGAGKLVVMTRQEPPLTVLGALIRQQRELADLSMRQVAATVGISNPYLSQIERGLRAPSDAVLNAIAESLQTSADVLYSEAGFVDPPDEETSPTLLEAIEAATELTATQRRSLAEVYRAFVTANTVRRPRGRG